MGANPDERNRGTVVRGVLISCPPPGERGVYERIYNRENVRYEWTCPVCGWVVTGEMGDTEQEIHKLADAHRCEAGWSALVRGT